MTLVDWIDRHCALFGSPYEALFARTVLPLVPGLNLETVRCQFPFTDSDGRQRYCDFVIQENATVRIAIEVDGFDKMSAGHGMSHDAFIDWQRRQASLTAQRWYVLRFANRDVQRRPLQCADQIGRLLSTLRAEAGRSEIPVAFPPTAAHASPLSAPMKRRPMWIATLCVAAVVAATGLHYSSEVPTASAKLGARVLGTASDYLANGNSSAIPGPSESGMGEVGVGPDRVEETMSNDAVADRHEEDRARALAMGFDGRAGAVGPRDARDHKRDTLETSCDHPIDWRDAGAHVNAHISIAGNVVRVHHARTVHGQPTWIDVGATYPSEQRVTVLIWGRHRAAIPLLARNMLGSRICATGMVTRYRGVLQMTIDRAAQLKTLP